MTQMTELPTKLDLNELETLALKAQDQEDRFGKVAMRVAPEVVLSLIAAARELEELKSAMAWLSEQSFNIDNVDYCAGLNQADICESAMMYGWKPKGPTNGR